MPLGRAGAEGSGGVGEPGLEHAPSVLVAQRARFHLVYRLVVRSYQMLAARADPATPRWHAWAAGLDALGDVAVAAALRRTERFGLGPRLALDTLDATAWSMLTPGPDDSPVLSGVPLAAEAGVRLGVAAMRLEKRHRRMVATRHDRHPQARYQQVEQKLQEVRCGA